jgi:hypothetical protein
LIHKKFKENWLKLLKYNRDVKIYEQASQFKERMKIPLTPLEVEGYIIYKLFEILYPRFINDQQNILDIIISEDGKKIVGFYLYETEKAGIHEQYRKLSNDLMIYQEKDLNNLDEFFNKIQSILVEKESIRISIMRIFKEQAIELINHHYDLIDECSNYEFLTNFVYLTQELFEKELLFLYPEPNGFKFIKDVINLLKGMNISKLFESFYEILPEFNFAILLDSDDLKLIIQLKKSRRGISDSNLSIDLKLLEEIGIELEGLSIYEIISSIKKKLDVENVFFINLNQIISIFSELFEIELPIRKNKALLVLQKALFGFRSYENLWYMTPRPKYYLSSIRFLLRLFGINLNLKKISHWSIPELLFNSFESYFGLYSKILIIFTDVNKLIYKKNMVEENLTDGFEGAVLIEFENSSPIKIIPIEKNKIIVENEENSLEHIRARISSQYGYVTSVLNIDKAIINKTIDNFVFKLSKFNPLAKLKAFRMYKKKYYFNMYPELPPFKLIKDNGVISLFRMILPILIDKHEF